MVDVVYLSDRFSPESEFGFGGYKTDIVDLRDGTEQRVSMRPYPKRSYSIAFDGQNAADINAIAAFFDDRRGMKLGFLIKDFTDYLLTDELILTAAGSETTAQIKKTIGSTNALTRTIRYINAATLVVKKNDVAMTLTTDYTVSATGLITFVVALTAADEITVSCEFFTPVRFAVDDVNKTLFSPDASLLQINRIPLVEVIE